MKSFALPSIGSAALCLLACSAMGAPEQDKPATWEQKVMEINSITQTQIAFLGVVSSPLDPIMTEQLELPHGEGVIIHAVAPESPAAKAGIAANDIVLGIDGIVIVSPLDLSKVMIAKKAGDTIHLKLIQKGKPTECDVALASRPAAFGKMQAESLHSALKKFRDFRGDPPENKDLQTALADMLAARNPNDMELQLSASIRIMDDQGCVEMKPNKIPREVVVRDKKNEVTWSGPWNTEAEKNAAPAEIRQRLKDLNVDGIFDSNQLRLKIPGTRPDGNHGKTLEANVPEK